MWRPEHGVRVEGCATAGVASTGGLNVLFPQSARLRM
jgi:hypothetical protein